MKRVDIIEELCESKSHRYTQEDVGLSISVVMEKINQEPSMYMLVSFSPESYLSLEDLLNSSIFFVDTSAVIEDGYHLLTVGFVDPVWANNADDGVFCKALALAIDLMCKLTVIHKGRKPKLQ